MNDEFIKILKLFQQNEQYKYKQLESQMSRQLIDT